MVENPRFSEYATSGAFAVSLTRNQVSSLGLLQGGGAEYLSAYMAGLERKGLAERWPCPTRHSPDAVEWRLTFAGQLAAQLCQEAGLVNAPPNPLRVEFDGLKAEIAARRQEAADARETARSALARAEALQFELDNERAKAAAGKLQVRILIRDPLPSLSQAELAKRAEEPAYG